MQKHMDIMTLEKKAVISFSGKKQKDILNRLPKMKKNGLEMVDIKDYGNAYIILKKWLNCAEWLLSLQPFKTDKKYRDAMISPKELSLVKDTLAELKKKISAPAISQNVVQGIEKMQIDENPLPDSSVKSTLTFPEIPKEDPIPLDLQDMSCIDLFYMNKMNSDRLLLIDVRTVEHFENSRIKNFKCINIPPAEITRGKTIKSIGEYLQKRDQAMYNFFKARGKEHIDVIVILDTTTDMNNVQNLYEIFRNWDLHCKYGKIAALTGGFTEWCHRYPTYVTNSNVKLPDIQKNNDSEILNSISYQNLIRFEDEESERSPRNVPNKSLVSETNETASSTKGILKNSTKSHSKNYMNDFSNSSIEKKHTSIYNPQNGSTNFESSVGWREASSLPKDFVDKQPKMPMVDRSCKPSLSPPSEASSIFMHLKKQRFLVIKEQLKIEREMFDLKKILSDNGFNDIYEETLRSKLNDLKKKHEQVSQDNINFKKKLDAAVKNDLVLSQLYQAESDRLDLEIGTTEQNLKALSINQNRVQKEMQEKLNMKSKEEDIYKEPLKSDGFSTNSGLKRSLSSPNLAQIDIRNVPQVDRSSKPAITKQNTNSDNKQKYLPNRADREQRMDPIFRSNQSNPGITGLKNLGNSCYMNSIIQCLSNTPSLAKYFSDDRYVEDLNDQNKNGQGQVAEEVAQVIKALWRGQYKSITPRDLKTVIGQYKFQFKSHDQQDSHEFLMFLLDWMHNDLKKEIFPQNESFLSKSEQAWCKAMKNQTSIISKLFVGQMRSTIKCSACNSASTTYDIFNSLTMSLSFSSKCTLDECIRKYVSGQKVSEWKCPTCKVPREATKKFDFIKLAPIIVIHLNRFGESGGWLEKRNTAVEFPLTDFNLEQYVVNDSESPKNNNYRQSNYSLYAMSNHYGTMEAGHYTAFCKSATQDKWYKYDDQNVSEVTKSTIKSQTSTAYLLFYSSFAGHMLPIHRLES